MSLDSMRVIILGSGSHAYVLRELHESQGGMFDGFLAPGDDSTLGGIPWLGSDDVLSSLDPATVQLVNGVGSITVPTLRRDIYSTARGLGFTFRSLVDQSSSIRGSATIRDGAQILPGVIIGSGVTVHENVLLNSGTIVEHDSVIGPHSHLSPGVTIAGGVHIGECVHVGIGATIIQGVTVGSNSIIGAGAVVVRDVPPGSVAVGVPAASHPHRNGDGHE